MLTKKLKGQGAMEYLMTYGWAILIVVIVGVALAALGVFNPVQVFNCDSSLSQLEPTDTGTLSTSQLVLEFVARRAMTINSVRVGTAATDTSPTVSDSNIQPTDRFTITTNNVPAGLASGQTFGQDDATINPININITMDGNSFTASVRCSGTIA